MLAGSSCQPGLAGGVIVLAFTGWWRSDGRGRRGRCGGLGLRAAWPGSAYRRSLAAVGPVVWSAVASDRSAVGASSAGIGALESWAGVGGAGRSPSVAALVGGLVVGPQQRGEAAAGTRPVHDSARLPGGEVAIQDRLDRRGRGALARELVALEAEPHDPAVAAAHDQVELAKGGHVVARLGDDRAADDLRLGQVGGRRAVVAAEDRV